MRALLIHPFSRSLSLAAALLFGAGCGGGTIRAIAPSPTPNVIPAQQLSGTLSIEVTGVTDAEVCARTAGLYDFCVQRFRGSLDEGLHSLLDSYVRPGGTEAYKATFRFMEFSSAAAAVNGVGAAMAATVSLKWQFVLFDGSGRQRLALAMTTMGPKPLANRDEMGPVTRALLEAALERIGAALNEASLQPDQAAAPPAQLPGPGQPAQL